MNVFLASSFFISHKNESAYGPRATTGNMPVAAFCGCGLFFTFSVVPQVKSVVKMVKLVATCAVLLLVASQVQLEPSKSKNAIARARRMFRQFIPEYISSAPPKILDVSD